jgi:SAM-dependent methyltransferase
VTFADAKQRFSNRVADYVRYRPGYPSALINVLRSECGLRPEHMVADVGSGTGLLCKLFLENGNRVFGVEPNEEMRHAGDEFLADHKNFSSVHGSSEATTLPDSSVDFITAAQAFHWFEPVATRREFLRILKPQGWVVAVWNFRERQTPFGKAYEDILVRYGSDYARVRESYPESHDMHGFFLGGEVLQRALPGGRLFDWDELAGLLRSASYMPQEGHLNFAPMMGALRELFDAKQKSGRVRMDYTTQIYFGRLDAMRNSG